MLYNILFSFETLIPCPGIALLDLYDLFTDYCMQTEFWTKAFYHVRSRKLITCCVHLSVFLYVCLPVGWSVGQKVGFNKAG